MTRFVFDSSWIQKREKRLRHQAIKDILNNGRREWSVFRTTNVGEEKIWKMGEVHVQRKRKDEKPIKGRGDIDSGVVLDTQLVIENDPPPQRHAVFVRWPDSRDLTKAI